MNNESSLSISPSSSKNVSFIYTYHFFIPELDHELIRSKLEAQIQKHFASSTFNTHHLSTTIIKNCNLSASFFFKLDSISSEGVSPFQIISNDSCLTKKFDFDREFILNLPKQQWKNIQKIQLIYSVQLLSESSFSSTTILQTYFRRCLGYILAFTRFMLSKLINNSLQIQRLNNNFLNFCLNTSLQIDFDKSYIDLMNYASESFKTHELIKFIKHQLDKYSRIEQLCLAFNGGKDCTVLLHALTIILHNYFFGNQSNADQYKLNLLYIKTTEPFPEADLFVHRMAAYYGCHSNLLIYNTANDIKSVLQIVKQDLGTNLEAIFMGVRRSDLPKSDRNKLKSVQLTDIDRGWPEFMRLNPLLDWTYSEVWDFLLRLNVPYCSLYDYGYTSIGDPNNTIANERLKQHWFSIEEKEQGVQQNSDCYYYLPAYLLDQEHTERNSRI